MVKYALNAKMDLKQKKMNQGKKYAQKKQN